MSAEQTDWLYNGLDCCVTLECLHAMRPDLDNVSGATYGFSLDLQSPILQMNMRGLRVDQDERRRVVREFRSLLSTLEEQFYMIVREGVGFPLENWQSPDQIKRLFYAYMQLPVQRKRNAHGKMAPSVDRDCLEKLAAYWIAQPLVAHLLAMRDVAKKISVLTTEIDPDGRIRSNFNIAGTETGRLSSSLGDFGTGGNLQNVEKRLRSVLVADRGCKFANIDLAQADARNVGAICYDLFGRDAYLDATESGDLHTTVCKLAWFDLAWGDDPDKWRAVADQKAYRHLSYRDMAKKLGHGTNYYGTPRTMAKHTKVETKIIEDFQRRYFGAFPEIKEWHQWTKREIRERGQLTNLFGRRRTFWGRRDDDATLREAIAYQGQSMTADEINRAMLNVWRLNCAQIMLQVHDSLVIQYPEEREAEVIGLVVPAMRSPLELRAGREFFVPCDVQTGWNLGEPGKDGSNPDGLIGWKGHDNRTRVRP
jgi:DNA polymerase-1